ncbi:MAG: hypothetical protein ABEJ05_13925 [Haloglomus sp.]
MSTARMRCSQCGFEVDAEDECPLCGHELGEEFPRTALNALFGD